MIRIAAWLLIGVNVLLAAFALRGSTAPAEIERVRAKVKAIDVTAEEDRWQKVGWVTDVGKALQYSQRYRRPVFILTHQGQLDGRC